MFFKFNFIYEFYTLSAGGGSAFGGHFPLSTIFYYLLSIISFPLTPIRFSKFLLLPDG